MDEGIRRLIELGINASPALRELEKLGVETQKQTRSIDGLQGTLDNFAMKLKGAFTGLAIGSAITQTVQGIRGLIDELDALNDQAQQVGLSVEALQEMQHVFSMSGMHPEDAVSALARLSDKMAEVGDKSSNTGRILRELGVTTSDTVDEGLAKMADAFSKSPDGINKTSLAIELFGRSLGPKMVTLLNNGRDGIAELREEAEKLGVASSDTAKKAAEFNDNMDRLGRSAKTLGISITGDLLPPLIALTNQLVEAIKQGNLWDTLMKRFRQNQDDQATLFKRFFGFGEGEQTHGEQAAQAQQWEDLAKKMEDARKASERLNAAGGLPSIKGPEKEKGGGKSAAKVIDEWEQWTKSIEKAGKTAEMVPEKIAYLQQQIAAIGDPATEKAKLRLEALVKALEGLDKAGPGAEAVKKLAEEAKKLDDAPKVVAAIEAELVRMQAAGPAAGSGVQVLTDALQKMNDELLKTKALKDPVTAVTLEIQKASDARKRNAAMETEFFARLGSEEGLSHEDFVLVNSFLTETGDKLEANAKKAKDLGEAVAEMGAKFVTDWVDKVVDGLGKTEVAFADMIESFLKQLLKLLMNQQMAKLITLLMPSAAGGGGGIASVGGSFSAQSFAGPAADEGDQLMRGGGALASPTFTRTVGYALVASPGVSTGTGSGNAAAAASPVNVVINNNAPVEVTTQNKDNADGSRQIEVFIEQKVKGMFTNGTMDRTMRQGYGLTRQPIAG